MRLRGGTKEENGARDGRWDGRSLPQKSKESGYCGASFGGVLTRLHQWVNAGGGCGCSIGGSNSTVSIH